MANRQFDYIKTKDQLGRPEEKGFLTKSRKETIQIQESPTQVTEDTIGHSWIVGSSTNGIVGDNTNTQDGEQQVVGEAGRVQTVKKVVTSNNTVYEKFTTDIFIDSASDALYGSGSALFSTGSSLTSELVYRDTTQISKATINVTGETTSNLSLYLSNQTDITKDVELCYRFNDGDFSNTTVYDFSKSGRTGTLTNYTLNDGSDTDISYTGDDPLGGSNVSAVFNGSSSKITISDNSSIQNIFDSEGTICAWVYIESDGENNAGRIFDKYNSSAGTGGYNLRVYSESGGYCRFRVSTFFNTANGDWYQTDRDTPIGEWVFFAMTYNADSTANNPTIYWKTLTGNMNVLTVGSGLTENNTPEGTRETDAGTDLVIGNNDADDGTFDGNICYGRIWKGIELTETQLETESNSAYPVRGENLVGSWDLNDNSNDTNYLATGKIGQGLVSKDNTENYVEEDINDTSDIFDGSGYVPYFDGSNGYANVPDDSSLQNVFDGGGTVCGWIWPRSVGENSYGRIADKTDSTNEGWAFFVGDGSGNIKLGFKHFFDSSPGEWRTSVSLGDRYVYFVAVTYDSSSDSNTPIIYVRGLNATSLSEYSNSESNLSEILTPSGTYVSDTGNDLYIGNRSNDDRTFYGGISHLRVWDTELTESELLIESNSPTAIKTSNLQGDWSMTGDIDDNSSNSNDGTLTSTNYDAGNPYGLTDCNFSLNVWAKADEFGGTSSTDYIIWRSDNRPTIFYSSSGSYCNFGTENNQGTAASSDLPSTGEWAMYTLTYDGLNLKGYINGVYRCNSKTIMTKNNSSASAFRIGCDGAAGREWRGVIDSPMIFSKELSNGYPSKSAVFNGSSSEIDLGTDNITATLSSYTITMWINATNLPVSARGYLYCDPMETNNRDFLEIGDDGKIIATTRKGGVNYTADASNSAISINTDYHIALVFDGSSLNIYLDGVLQTGSTSSPYNITVGGNALLGSRPAATDLFDGSMSYVRIWNTNLTESEIQSEMNSTSPVKTTNLVGNWDLTENSNDSVGNNNGTDTDIVYQEGNPFILGTDETAEGEIAQLYNSGDGYIGWEEVTDGTEHNFETVGTALQWKSYCGTGTARLTDVKIKYE